jgi:quinol monooxygenase YgiN
MIRLTVLYNLPPGADEAEFLRWRLGEHQAENEASPGVVYTDFARVDSQWTPNDPAARPPHRFMTIAEWEDRAAFEAAFLTPESQEELRGNLERIADAVFLVSEILITSDKK